MAEIRRMLVAIDFSDLSPMVMDYARTLAIALRARLLVVHIVYDLSYFTGAYSTDVPLPELQQRLESEAREHLEELCQTELGNTVAYETLVVTGRPVAEINRVVREYGIDCLIIGAHSTDKPEHQLFGCTAERLFHQTYCPVLMIPPPKSSEIITEG